MIQSYERNTKHFTSNEESSSSSPKKNGDRRGIAIDRVDSKILDFFINGSGDIHSCRKSEIKILQFYK
jgi:hypothetical protein